MRKNYLSHLIFSSNCLYRYLVSCSTQFLKVRGRAFQPCVFSLTQDRCEEMFELNQSFDVIIKAGRMGKRGWFWPRKGQSNVSEPTVLGSWLLNIHEFRMDMHLTAQQCLSRDSKLAFLPFFALGLQLFVASGNRLSAKTGVKQNIQVRKRNEILWDLEIKVNKYSQYGGIRRKKGGENWFNKVIVKTSQAL